MMFYTHMAFAFLVAMLSIKWLHPANQILFLILVLFAAALPDIDHPNSKLGSKFKIFSWLFEHRGFFHSALAMLLFSLLAFYFLKQEIYFFAVLIGYGSHLFTDLISVQGIRFMYPSKKHIKGFIKTGGLLEIFLLIIFIVLGFWQLLNL